MFLKTYINDLHISEGDRVRSDCPMCKGRNTFTASKIDGNVIYNCYKLGCDARGVESIGFNKIEIGKRLSRLNKDFVDTDSFELPEYVTHDINNSLMQIFIRRWNLQNVYLLYDVKDNRAVFPIRNSKGKLIDAVGRSLNRSRIKWLRYSGKADYYASEKNTQVGSVVVVEDIISAINVSTIFNCTGIAILGTSLNHVHKQVLSKYNTVLIALDPDATKKTLQYTIDLRNYVDTVKAVSLTDDIKYQNIKDIETIEELLNESRTY